MCNEQPLLQDASYESLSKINNVISNYTNFKIYILNVSTLIPGWCKNKIFNSIVFATPLTALILHFYFQNWVFLCFPKGGSNRKYSNIFFLHQPRPPRYFPILRAKLTVLKLSQDHLNIVYSTILSRQHPNSPNSPILCENPLL